jgi:hypothetical protein
MRSRYISDVSRVVKPGSDSRISTTYYTRWTSWQQKLLNRAGVDDVFNRTKVAATAFV